MYWRLFGFDLGKNNNNSELTEFQYINGMMLSGKNI